MYMVLCTYIRVGLYLTIQDYIVSPIPSHGTENLQRVFQSRQAPELPSEWSITDQIPGSDQLSSSRATELSRHSIRGAERATDQTTNRVDPGDGESGSSPKERRLKSHDILWKSSANIMFPSDKTFQ